MYLVNLRTKERFLRYFDSGNPTGNWLTRTPYQTPAQARAGLALPSTSTAVCWQNVTASRRTLGLRGHITNGDPKALQWFIFVRNDLSFGPCQSYPAR
jgi:hypothetical protein